MKRTLRKTLITLLVLFGGLIAVIVIGALSAQDLLARRALAIVNTYLVPDAEFDDFRWIPPRAIEFENFRLVAPDGTQVVRAGRAMVNFTNLPLPGRRLAIETIELEDARVILERDTSSDTLVFKGLIPFVKRESFTDQQSVDEELRLDEAFSIRTLRIVNAGVSVDLMGDGDPTVIDGIEIDADVVPETDAQGDVWHSVTINSDRAPVFTLDAEAGLRLRTLTVRLDRGELAWSLDGTDYSALPPGIQSTLREMEARGHLAATATGLVELQDYRASNIQSSVSMKDLNLALGEYRLHVDAGTVQATMAERAVEVFMRFELFDGTLEIDPLAADLTQDGMPVTAAWLMRDVRLRQILRTRPTDGAPPKLAGALSTNGTATTSLSAPRKDLKGQGMFAVREGRLINIPLVSGLARSLKATSADGSGPLSDRADIEFEMTPEGLRITKGEVVSSVVAARATGVIGFDAMLDLSVNAGPLEKVQSMLGRVGDVFGALTDKLVTYRVTGPVGDPSIAVQPLGVGGNGKSQAQTDIPD